MAPRQILKSPTLEYSLDRPRIGSRAMIFSDFLTFTHVNHAPRPSRPRERRRVRLNANKSRSAVPDTPTGKVM
jgi:hypothetical protein